MRKVMVRRLLWLLAAAYASQGLGLLYRRLGAPWPGVLAVGTVMAGYGLLRGAAVLYERHYSRRAADDEERVEAWVKAAVVPVVEQLGRPTMRRPLLKTLESDAPHFQCPRCGIVSWNPRDLQEGYCGRCHDWTAPRSPAVESDSP